MNNYILVYRYPNSHNLLCLDSYPQILSATLKTLFKTLMYRVPDLLFNFLFSPKAKARCQI